MSEFEFIKEPERAGRQKSNNLKVVLFFRWIFLVVGFPMFYFSAKPTPNSYVFFLILAFALVYNFLISIYSKKNYSKMKRFPNFIIYIDILLLCALSYQMGGIDSDLYILFFFILCFGETYKFLSNTMLVGAFCVIAYTLTCLHHAQTASLELNYWRLCIKDCLLLLAAYSTCRITEELKKYSELHRKEFKMARTDKLTGLANRHYLEQKLSEETQYADYSGLPLNILIFDLDNFKKFNDTYGHTWGDKLLSLFSDIIKQNIRTSDIPIRYGGEEFILLVRELDSEMAKSVADRIRRQLEKQRIFIGEDQNRTRVTVSCGIAQYPLDSTDIKEVIEFADKALYHAKELGKNIVVAYNEIGKIQRPVQIDIDMYMKG